MASPKKAAPKRRKKRAPAPAILPERRKVAIFGTTPSRMEGPVDGQDGWQRWTIGPGGMETHGWERLFEMHSVWPADFQDYLNKLSKLEPPLQVVTLPQPDNPAETWKGAIERWFRTHNLDPSVIEGKWAAQVRYPREHMLERYQRRMWFSSSIAWLITLAMEEGATDIGLWGIDLESGEEYISQHIGCAHFLDMARILGVNVHLPKHSGLLRDPAPYPDKNETLLALYTEKKEKFLGGMIGNLEPQFDTARQEAARIEGRILETRDTNGPPERIHELEGQLVQLHARIGQLAANINQLRGEASGVGFIKRMFTQGLYDPNEKLDFSV